MNSIKEKINSFNNFSTDIRWFDWLNNNSDRVKMMFEDNALRNFIFEPFKGVFTASIKTIDENKYSVITQVAIINAVLAGLPGKMGIGVFVSMALEAWMAYSIANHVGVKIKSPKDIAKYFGLVASVIAIIIWGIKILLGFSFSLFSVIPGINPLIIAELFVTNFIGILFWIGFKEVKRKGTFIIPKLAIKKSFYLTKGLFNHQMSILKNVFNMKNIKSVGEKLAVYLKGEIPIDYKIMNGEVLPIILMGYLISKNIPGTVYLIK